MCNCRIYACAVGRLTVVLLSGISPLEPHGQPRPSTRYDEEHRPASQGEHPLAYTLTALGLASTYATVAMAQPQQPSTQKKLELAPQYNLRTAEQKLQPGLASRWRPWCPADHPKSVVATVALYARYSPDSQTQRFDRGPVPDLPRTRQAKTGWLLLLTRDRASRAQARSCDFVFRRSCNTLNAVSSIWSSQKRLRGLAATEADTA